MSNNVLTVGEKIRLLRKEHGLTQIELSLKAGLNSGTVRCYENGRYKPSPKVLSKLSTILEVPVEYFSDSCQVSPDLVRKAEQGEDEISALKTILKACYLQAQDEAVSLESGHYFQYFKLSNRNKALILDSAALEQILDSIKPVLKAFVSLYARQYPEASYREYVEAWSRFDDFEATEDEEKDEIP